MSKNKLTDRQLKVMAWISDGCPDDGRWPDETHKLTARALAGRGFVRIERTGRSGGKQWHASLTDRGQHQMNALMTPVRDQARFTVAAKSPSNLNAYAYATEAWQVWEMLTRRRQTTPHGDEFKPMNLNGPDGDRVKGWVWDQPLAEAIRLKHGGNGGGYSAKMMRDWLQGTGNAANVGGRGVAAVWWIRDKWNDVKPGDGHEIQLDPDRAPVKPHAAGRAASTPLAGMEPCRFCTQAFFGSSITRRHERFTHPQEYLDAAEYICPLTTAEGVCNYPSHDAKGFGKHLSADHDIDGKADRSRIAMSAQTLAHRRHADRAAGLPETGPTADETPLAVVTPAPAEPDAPAASEPVAEIAVPEPAKPDEDTPVSYEPETKPDPVAPAAVLAAAAAKADRAGPVSVAEATRAFDVIATYMRHQLTADSDIAAKLADANDRAEAEKERADAAEQRLAKFQAVAGAFLDLATS